MARRLIKVAKELQMGTGKIVNFLEVSGFEIENRPTAQLSPAMYNLLVAEFVSPKNSKLKTNKQGELSSKKQTKAATVNNEKQPILQPQQEEEDLQKPSNSLHLEIHQNFGQHKKLTEYIVAILPFQWQYSIAKYQADLTVAIPFTLFDKVICGILQLDEAASLEEIGLILGLNVVDKPEQSQYLDPAEKGILENALRSLEDFGMITTGDSSFSKCRLTSVGKTFVAKGMKFETHPDSTFSVFYDNTSLNHKSAKSWFGQFRNSQSIEISNFDYQNEDLIRELSAVQLSSIYNPTAAYPRTYQNLRWTNTLSFQVPFWVCIVADTATQQFRFELYNPKNNQIQTELTAAFNAREDFKEQLLLRYLSHWTPSRNNPFKFKNFNDKAIQKQKALEKLLEYGKQNEALALSKQFYSTAKWIEESYFLSDLNKMADKETREVCLVFKKMDEKTLELLQNFVDEKAPQLDFLYIALPKGFQLNCDLHHVWIMNADDIEQSAFYFKNDKNTLAYTTDYFSITVKHEDEQLVVEKELLVKKQIPNAEEDCFLEIRNSIGKALFETKIDALIASFQDFTVQNISKSAIKNLEHLERYILPFENLQTVEIRLKRREFTTFHRMKKDELNKIYHRKIANELKKLSGNIHKHFNNEAEVRDLLHKVHALKKEVLNEDDGILKEFKQAEGRIYAKINAVKAQKTAKTYLIDTNVFIDEPNIIKLIPAKHSIILSGQVIEELDRKKTNTRLKDSVSLAIKNIKVAQESKRVQVEFGDMKVLPTALRRTKSPDNLILSLVVIYQQKNKANPVLITSDNGLQIKAKALKIKTISYKEFKKNNTNRNNSKKQRTKRKYIPPKQKSNNKKKE